jgi:F-type H+-transporting ATPase subunit delta
MSTTISSKRYAQAVFNIAQESNEIDKWQAYLKKIAELMSEPEYIAIAENPALPFDLKAKYTEEKLGKISPLALNLACLLIAKNKCKIAAQIAENYDRLMDEYHGIKRAEVITAIPLDNKDRSNLERQLETITGSKITVQFQTDPDIIGGIIARVDGRLIDGSIRSKLEILRRNLVGT